MPRSLIFLLVALLFGCGITMIGFVTVASVGNVVLAPGAAISFWLYSGRVHEIGYALAAIAINCVVYATLAYLCIGLYRFARSAVDRKKGLTSE